MAVINTIYKQSRKKLTICISPEGLAKNQIDYVLVPIDQERLIKYWKKILNWQDLNNLQFRNTTESYGEKRSEKSKKKTTRKQRNWKIILKGAIHIIYSNQYVNWTGKLKRALSLLSTEKNKIRKIEEVLKFWK